jgi:hypothetical protein
MTYKIYSGTVTDAHGIKRNLRLMHTVEEFDALVTAGVLPDDTCEVIGMIDQAQKVEAQFESQAHRYTGGRFQ